MERIWLGSLPYMGIDKSQVDFLVEVLVAMHRDVSSCYHISEKERSRDELTIRSRIRAEGVSFLTKTLPSLGKALDRAMSSNSAFSTKAFAKRPGTVVPSFLGWLLSLIIDRDGHVRSDADPYAVKRFRQLTLCLYKLELDPDSKSISKVLDEFVTVDASVGETLDFSGVIAQEAKTLITRILGSFDPTDIYPRHGPGAVSTGERLWEKFHFKRYFRSVDRVYPYSEYFFLNLGQVCDGLQELQSMKEAIPTAKVVLVPKDSRGPRLISCEPLEIQWIQQGLSRKLVGHLETHPLTRGHVNFANQSVNRDLALKHSRVEVPGRLRMVTLDMKEASDRVSLQLVKHLFSHCEILEYLLATRSECTKLPDGRVVEMNKFAPMGSALCFPVEALCFFALSVAAIRCRRGISLSRATRLVYVYGDDIIVPEADTACVIEALERYHLKVNADKCCTGTFFRESCGMDAFNGIPVTPTRFRRVLCHTRRSHSYLSWVVYSNALWNDGYTAAAELIKDSILDRHDVWTLPKPGGFTAFVREYAASPVPSKWGKTRWNGRLQRREYLAYAATTQSVVGQYSSRSELLRVLAKPSTDNPGPRTFAEIQRECESQAVRATNYSDPRRVYLKRGWVSLG